MEDDKKVTFKHEVKMGSKIAVKILTGIFLLIAVAILLLSINLFFSVDGQGVTIFMLFLSFVFFV
ncbi:hypothetical protein [Gracilibacillus lacisalsi]|uniref:hypothetical protein n=1 Tax=Gracilibacillus lacisalsi TaxID=393087 RepID=UPI000363D55A|nr:hypothetical protein [Gracilibacillus lacisalsi]